jgi:hypothetical protein
MLYEYITPCGRPAPLGSSNSPRPHGWHRGHMCGRPDPLGSPNSLRPNGGIETVVIPSAPVIGTGYTPKQEEQILLAWRDVTLLANSVLVSSVLAMTGDLSDPVFYKY